MALERFLGIFIRTVVRGCNLGLPNISVGFCDSVALSP